MTRDSKAMSQRRSSGTAAKDEGAGEANAQQDSADTGEVSGVVTVLSHQELERLRARLARKYH